MVDYKFKIAEVIKNKIPDLSIEEILENIEIPGDSSMGDYAFPCFRLAKVLRKSPNMIAADLAEGINKPDFIKEIKNVSAYVNFFLNQKKYMEDILLNVLKSDHYGSSKEGEGKKVLVEFSSPNIAKPFHIGHIRSTVIGNSLYKIYQFLGYDVMRLNHLGDYGTQFGKMISAYRRWGNAEDVNKDPIRTLLSYYTRFHKEAEQDSSLNDEARENFLKLEQGNSEELELWQWFRDLSLKEFRRVYDILGIQFDSYNGESFFSDKMSRFINELEDKNLLLESQGAKIVDLSDFGMEVALIQKSDGSTLYITRDIAAAVYRKETYDFYKNIYVVASQQDLHFKQWIKILDLLGYSWAYDCVHVPFGLVSLKDDTMSTRSGNVIFLEDVLNKAISKTKEIILEKNSNLEEVDDIARAVGIGAVIFNELSNSKIKDYTFSWDNVLNFEGETGPYVQYTYARASSLLRKAGIESYSKLGELDFSYLEGQEAFELVKSISKFPETIKSAAISYEPSFIARNVVDVAQNFNRYYNKNHVIVEDKNEMKAKLALVISTKQVLEEGLSLLGIKAPKKM